MTAFTARYIFVFFFMAEDTGQLCVFRINAGQGVADTLMTGRTALIGRFCTKSDSERLMCRMACQAVFIDHVC